MWLSAMITNPDTPASSIFGPLYSRTFGSVILVIPKAVGVIGEEIPDQFRIPHFSGVAGISVHNQVHLSCLSPPIGQKIKRGTFTSPGQVLANADV